MNLREFSGQVLVRAAIISIEQHVDWPTANKLAAKEIAAAERQRVRSMPKASRQSLPTYTPAPAYGDDDYSNELATAKDRLFAKLSDYFRRHDANVARELAAKRAAKRAERIARKVAKAGLAPRNNVVPLIRPDDAPQPEQPVLDTHPTAHLVYSGGSTGAVRIEDPRPSPATANWRDSIERNERLQQQRNAKP
jgi:hypothetical protein